MDSWICFHGFCDVGWLRNNTELGILPANVLFARTNIFEATVNPYWTPQESSNFRQLISSEEPPSPNSQSSSFVAEKTPKWTITLIRRRRACKSGDSLHSWEAISWRDMVFPGPARLIMSGIPKITVALSDMAAMCPYMSGDKTFMASARIDSGDGSWGPEDPSSALRASNICQYPPKTKTEIKLKPNIRLKGWKSISTSSCKKEKYIKKSPKNKFL